MADITISPIPYGGGSISIASVHSSIVPLNNTYTRWVYKFQQTSPDLSIFGLVEITPSIKTSSPTINYIKQRAFPYLSTNIRLYKLSPTRIMSVDMLSISQVQFKVYDISSNDFIEVASYTYTDNRNSSSQDIITIIPLSNNSFIFSTIRSDNRCEVSHVSFTDGSTTFTINPLTLPSPSYSTPVRVRYKQISTDLYMIYAMNTSSALTTMILYNSTSNTVTVVPLPSGVRDPIVMSPTDIIFFASTKNYYYVFDGSSFTNINEPVTYGTYDNNIDHGFKMTNDSFLVTYRHYSYQAFYYDSSTKKVLPSFNTYNYQTFSSIPSGYSYFVFNNQNMYILPYGSTELMTLFRDTSPLTWYVRVFTFE